MLHDGVPKSPVVTDEQKAQIRAAKPAKSAK